MAQPKKLRVSLGSRYAAGMLKCFRREIDAVYCKLYTSASYRKAARLAKMTGKIEVKLAYSRTLSVNMLYYTDCCGTIAPYHWSLGEGEKGVDSAH